MDMLLYRELKSSEVNCMLFAGFVRTQQVTKCWRRIDNRWCIMDDPFVDDWSAVEYEELMEYLREALAVGGFAAGAFLDGQLKGFVVVEAAPFGSQQEYLQLSNLHVSQEMRRRGIGRELFQMAADWARAHGAQKLYLSAHSAVESQAFYRSMGCVEAKEYNQALVEKEPFDCQLEYRL